jgi:GT2 family glycosyltransferase
MSTAPTPVAGVETLTVGVVLCCYTLDRWERILAALDSLEAQTRPADEVIVVVDHHAGLARGLRTERPGVRLVENAGPRGLSGARNTGVAVATSDVVAFLDDDAEADPHWVAGLLAGYEDPSVLGVGGQVTPAWEAGRPRWFPPEFDWVVGCSHLGLPDEPTPVRNLVGANMSFRRAALAALDGFDARLGRVGTTPVGCEETELCIRLVRANPGSVLVYRPQAGVLHHVPAGRGTWAYFRRRCYSEGLSRAVVRDLVGAERALSSERDYTLRTLPRGVARSVATGRPASAVAIVVGLLSTIGGYVAGRLARPRGGVR